jgi:acyl phosphate:glycerol-3-phosphate acyltransferase
LPTFPWFKEIVYAGPSDRTAYQTIIPADAPKEQKDALASALAGSVVGPIFPRYFVMQAVCAFAALGTAWAWRKHPPRVHARRYGLCLVAALLVALGWPLSEYVSMLRFQRFDPDAALAATARSAFVGWHLVSLLLSFLTTVLAGLLLLLAAKLPENCGDSSNL